jgi:glutamate-1-semialdehyde 2,1-aminomutase
VARAWYIDYVGGAGANILGHAHPEVMAAVRPQIEKGLHFFGTLNDTAIELAETLVRLIPCADRVAFSSTGSEATFYAMRIARAYTGRQKILKFEGAYHGNHDYCCSPPCWSPPTTTWRRSSASSPSTRTTSPPSSSRGCSA